MRLTLVDPWTPPLSAKITEAARRYDAGAPSQPPVTAIDDAAMLPRAHVSCVAAKVGLFDARYRPSGRRDIFASLDLHDAVFGAGSSADATVALGDTHYKLHAILTPQTTRAAAPGRATAQYAGTLSLHVETDHGYVWDRVYVASGPIELEGGTVVAPTGLVLPGAHSPSPEPTRSTGSSRARLLGRSWMSTSTFRSTTIQAGDPTPLPRTPTGRGRSLGGGQSNDPRSRDMRLRRRAIGQSSGHSRPRLTVTADRAGSC
jgi:hypothetical protein